MYRRRAYYGPAYGRGFGGRGWGYGPGVGRRRFASPYCDWYPDRPRGWWAMPEYQGDLQGSGYVVPPAGARWDPYGKPDNKEAIDHEISLLQREIEVLQKEIEHLKSLDRPAK